MTELANKIRKASEFSREINGWRLRLRRPTVGELHEVFAMGKDGPMTELEIAARFTINWDGVKECDLVKSGSTDIVSFDEESWRLVLMDDPPLWKAVCQAIMDEIDRQKQRKEERGKN